MELVEQVKLLQQTRRNEARAKQEMAELMAYEKQYGRVGLINFLCFVTILCLVSHRLLFGTEKLT